MTKLYNEIQNLNREIRAMYKADEISYIRMGGRSRLTELENKVRVLEDKYLKELQRLEIL